MSDSDEGHTRRNLLAVLGAAGIASLAGCNALDGSDSVDQPDELPDLDTTGLIYVREIRNDLPTRPQTVPSVGITSEGNYVYDGDEWLGPIGLGSVEHPATPSHFRSATVYGPFEALDGVVDGDVFDIRAYDAAVDGETDDLGAIENALEEAAEVAGTVVIPPGTTRIANQITLGPQHSGVTIRGYGYDSHLQLAGGKSDNHHGIRLEQQNGAAVSNVSIENLRLDGNRQQQNDDHGIGLQLTENRGPTRDVSIQNVWAHDWTLSGIDIRRGGVVLDGATVWNNRLHGVGAFHEDASPNLISNVYAWKNGMYGIDISRGRNIVNGFVVVENGWGFKTGGGNPEMTVFANGSAVANENFGFQMTGRAGVVMMDNIEARDNGSSGFRFDQGGTVFAGTLVATGNQGNANIRVGSADLYADSVLVQGARNAGLLVTGNARIGNLITGDNGTDIRIDSDGTLSLDYTDAQSVRNTGRYVENNVAKLSLGGETPDARQFTTGVFVKDTDSNRVYLIHDAGSAGGYARLS